MTAAVWAGVALLGGVGAVLRFLVDRTIASRIARSFPFGTLVVNLSGSFALGVLVGTSASHRIALLLGTGFTGGYTTFSTWMVETERLGEVGEIVSLLRNLWLSMLTGFAVTAAGFYVGQAIT